MVTVNDVTQMMFRWAPPELAMDWDNVGLLVGRGDREVHRVLVALMCLRMWRRRPQSWEPI